MDKPSPYATSSISLTAASQGYHPPHLEAYTRHRKPIGKTGFVATEILGIGIANPGVSWTLPEPLLVELLKLYGQAAYERMGVKDIQEEVQALGVKHGSPEFGEAMARWVTRGLHQPFRKCEVCNKTLQDPEHHDKYPCEKCGRITCDACGVDIEDGTPGGHILCVSCEAGEKR